MLKIIIGAEKAKELDLDKKFVEFPNRHFNRVKEQDWFRDDFVKKIIKDIDKSEVELGYSIRNIENDCGYSVDSISGGSKFLILVHKVTDKIFLATMGDNCTDLLEQIALEYEKEGKDLIIVSNYLHHFNFKYIHSIEYLNWNIVCHSWQEIYDKVYELALKQEFVSD